MVGKDAECTRRKSSVRIKHRGGHTLGHDRIVARGRTRHLEHPRNGDVGVGLRVWWRCRPLDPVHRHAATGLLVPVSSVV